MPSSFTPRSRKSSFANPTTSSGPSGHVPTTFFLASEQHMEDTLARQSTQRRSSGGDGLSFETSKTGAVADKVQSIEEALSAAFGSGNDTIKGKPLSRSSSGKDRSSDAVSDAGKKRKRKGRLGELESVETLISSGVETPRHDPKSAHSSPQPSQKAILGHVRRLSGATSSAPLTPANIESPAYHLDSGFPSTPKSISLRSLRLSDDGDHDEFLLNDNASQAVASTDDEDDDVAADHHHHHHHHADSIAPELVMPSIAMPSRRPFTVNGRQLGRLKIMVVGRAGTGKTGLVRSIVQVCEDIVHVDPVPVPITVLSADAPADASNARGQTPPGVKRASEIYASTRAYPAWWSDIEESRVLRRRKSMGLGDTILERNISFIDTPGFDASDDMDAKVLHYIETLMSRSTSPASMSDSEMLHMLSGGGGLQVDVVLFIFGPDTSPADLAFSRRLSALTNVIPLFGRADIMDQQRVTKQKVELLEQLQSSDVRPFLFGRTIPATLKILGETEDQGPAVPEIAALSTSQHNEHNEEGGLQGSEAVPPFDFTQPLPPFAVSSAPGPDYETMDASLLMSPDYCPPPVPSELQALVQMLFEPQNAAWLRHSSARKLLAWRRNNLALTTEYGQPASPPGSPWKLGLGMPSSASLARMAALGGPRSTASDRASVPKWAANLRQALRHERARDGSISLSDQTGQESAATSRPHGPQKRSLKSQKPKRHWSEASTSTSRPLQRDTRQDMIERMSSVTWSALRIVGIVSAVSVTACVVARRCFGIDGVTIGWDWN